MKKENKNNNLSFKDREDAGTPSLQGGSMKIDESKWYDVNLKDIQSIWWKPYSKEAFRISVEVPEFLTVTKCTFGIPKTLRPGKNKFSIILGSIFDKSYSDDLLKNPKKLADILTDDLAERRYKAKFTLSSNAEHPLNVEAIIKAGAS